MQDNTLNGLAGMPKIDFDFIHDLEGGSILNGYVPDAANSKSGVTVAIGFDLGARNPQDLKSLGLNSTLVGKLYPYLGRKGLDAQDYVSQHPLQLSENEANAINYGVKSAMVSLLVERYGASSNQTFFDIPPCWQTVIASLEFQYGSAQKKCPSFWRMVTSQNWQEALKELRDFGDRYPTRRNREADYVEANS